MSLKKKCISYKMGLGKEKWWISIFDLVKLEITWKSPPWQKKKKQQHPNHQVQKHNKQQFFRTTISRFSIVRDIWNLTIFVTFLWKMLSQKKPQKTKTTKKIFSSIFRFLLSNPGYVRRAADWEQRKKIKKGYQQVTFFKVKRALFLDLLPCLWKRHRKKETIDKRDMNGNVDNNVCLYSPSSHVWDNLSMWEFFCYFSEKRLMSVLCGFHRNVYTNKLNRAGEHVAHDQP